MYDFGTLGKSGEGAISATIKLVRNIFYRKKGTTAPDQFVLTKDLMEASPDVVVVYVGRLIIELAKIQTSEVYTKALNKMAKMTDEKQKVNALKSVISQTKTIVKEKMKDSKGWSLADRKDQKFRELLPSDVTNYAVDAYFECLTESLFPSFTPLMILQALLYQSTKCNKFLLKDYYEEIKKEFSGAIKEGINFDEEWQKASFEGQGGLLKEELQQVNITTENIHEMYEKIVFMHFLPSEYPPEAAYSTAHLILPDGRSTGFYDCMDTTMRNVCNFLSYDQKNKRFDIDVLERRLGTKVSDRLRRFYAQHHDPTRVAEPAVHDAWVQDVISNMPFVSYNSYDENQGSSGMGFIRFVNGDLAKKLQDVRYTVCADTSYLYEVNPSIKNIIVILNDLLGLNLYTDIKEEFLREDFIKTYLPMLLDRLHAQSNEKIDLEKIDAQDYKQGIVLFLKGVFEDGYDINVRLAISPGHGQFENRAQTEESSRVPFPKTLDPLTTIMLHQDAAMLSDSNKAFTYLGLFSLSLSNPDRVENIVEALTRISDSALDLLLYCAQNHTDIQQKMRVALRVWQFYIQKGGKKHKDAIAAASEGMKSSDYSVREESLKLFKVLIEKGHAYMDAATAVKEGRAHFNADVRRSVEVLFELLIKKFKALFEEGQAYTEAIAVASEWGKSSDSSSRRSAIELFEALFKKGQGYTEAAAVASQWVKSSYNIVKDEAVKLLKTLVEQGQGYAAAVAAVREVMKSSDNSDNYVRKAAIELLELLIEKLKILVEQGQGYTEAIAVASEWVKSSDRDVRESALELFEVLFEKGQGYAAAIAVASEWMNSSYYDDKESVLVLFEALFENGQGYTEALVAVREGMPNIYGGKEVAVKLLKALLEKLKILIEKGHGDKENIMNTAIAVASEWATSSDSGVRGAVLRLFKALVETRQEYTAAIAAASEGLKHPSPDVRKPAIDLLKVLIEKKQGYTEAVSVARDWVQNSDYSGKIAAIDLLRVLVENGVKDGVDVARKALRGGDRYNRSLTKSYDKLMKAVDAFDAAKDLEKNKKVEAIDKEKQNTADQPETSVASVPALVAP
jgi:hypothetical protein